MLTLHEPSRSSETYKVASESRRRLSCYNVPMASFSFDIVSEYDKAEMNNVFMQTVKELSSRYDFKGTAAELDWMSDKSGFKLVGDNEWQV